jgi:adenosylcobinamide kinase/adenosylcobinamide-phosphate guanylyltransferase
MLTLVIGAAASGKSEYAEKLITDSGVMPRTYIATMRPYDDESVARIEKHRRMRKEKAFRTAECYTWLKSLKLDGGAVLLECMSNLTANELFDPDGAGDDTVREICRGVDSVLSQCDELVIVSNDVFSAGSDYGGDTLRYLRVLADINRYIAAEADNVCEVVCGQAIYYKGKERIQ